MKKELIFAIIITGISSIITQLVILRESISSFYANELLLGILLGNWLLLIGIGAYLGKYAKNMKNKIKAYSLLMILSAVIVVFMLFFMRAIRNLIAAPGELIGLFHVTLFSFIALMPFCLIQGFQFTLSSSILAEKKKNKASEITNVYLFDSMADMIGGLIFSYILVCLFNSFQAIYFIVFLNLIAAFLLARVAKSRMLKTLCLTTSLIFILFFSFFNLNNISASLQYPNQKIIFNKNSIYGNVVVTQENQQLNFYENSFPLFNTLNVFSNEEKVHYAMLQSKKPKEILLVSGGVSGTINQILKYNISQIDYVELDPLLILAGKRFTNNLKHNQLKVYNVDARLFVKKIKKKYDVVIIDMPDPDSVQLNRFYTLEFFNEIKNILNKQGVVSLSIRGSENYLSREAKLMNSVIYNTLNKAFSNVIVIPGHENYFIASDNSLDYDYKNKIAEKGIKTDYIEYYIDGKLTKDRIDYINKELKQKTRLNLDFRPISHYYYLNYWLNLFNVNFVYIIVFILLIVFIVFHIIRLKAVPFSIFITGFSGMSLEIIIIIAFQILYGYIYKQIGVIVTAFLIGLLIGALYSKRLIKKDVANKTLAKADFLIFFYSILLSIGIFLLSKIHEKSIMFLSTQIIIPILTIILGFLVGVEFPIALKIYLKNKETEKTVGLLYFADLSGAFIAAYIVSVLLIPLLSIFTVCFIVGALNLVSGIWLLVGVKKRG